jgi:hypothetical protein
LFACFYTSTTMAKHFANMVDHAVSKDKGKNSKVAAASANGLSKTKTNKTTSAVSPPTNIDAPLSASKRQAAADANWDKVTTAAKFAGVIAKNQRATAGQKLVSRKLVSAMTWEIFSPPPLNSVSGKIVPRVLNRYKHRRLVSLEVHRVTPILEDNDGTKTRSSESSHSYDECVLRYVKH